MKISEQWFEQDGKVIHKRTHDHNPTLDLAERLRSAGANGFSDNRLVGVIDKGMLAQWANEAGLKGSDPSYWEKLREVVKRKMLDGDFAKFRVWEGTY